MASEEKETQNKQTNKNPNKTSVVWDQCDLLGRGCWPGGRRGPRERVAGGPLRRGADRRGGGFSPAPPRLGNPERGVPDPQRSPSVRAGRGWGWGGPCVTSHPGASPELRAAPSSTPGGCFASRRGSVLPFPFSPLLGGRGGSCPKAPQDAVSPPPRALCPRPKPLLVLIHPAELFRDRIALRFPKIGPNRRVYCAEGRISGQRNQNKTQRCEKIILRFLFVWDKNPGNGS